MNTRKEGSAQQSMKESRSDRLLMHLFAIIMLFVVFVVLIFPWGTSQALENEDVARGLLQKSKSPGDTVQTRELKKPSNNNSLLKEKVEVPSSGLEALAFSSSQSNADVMARNELENILRDRAKISTKACNNNNMQYLSVCNNNDKKVIVQSKLPLMGVNYMKVTGKEGQIGSKAVLMPHLALPAYQKAISHEMQEMQKLQIMEEQRGIKKRRDLDLTTHMIRYYQLATVAAVLGNEEYLTKQFVIPEDSTVNKSEIVQVASISDAVSYIASNFHPKVAYISPPRPQESIEITPFGKAFYDELSKKMNNQMSKSQFGSEIISGVYSLDRDGMLLIYQHYNKDYLLMNQLSMRLDKNAVGKLRTSPIAADIDQLFVKKDTSNAEFQSQIATQKGTDDLLFRKGETIRLFVRLSKPGYFYLVGHVSKPTGEYSYLVDLNEGDGPEKFITYVRPDQANQIINLGEFDVDAPFGVEYLQLVSATKDLKDKLPTFSYDKKLGYYVLNNSMGNVKAGIEEVRALKRVDNTMRYSESQLAYTTME